MVFEFLNQAQPRRFAADRSGQVAYLFGLMAIPILFAVGAGLDYGRHRSAKVRLDSALDASILSVASRRTTSTAINQNAIKRMPDAHFRKQVDSIKGIKIPAGEAGFKVRVAQAGAGLTVTADYTATLATTAFTRLMGFDAMGLSGTATAANGNSKFMDFHLLLDNSPSMGLAATAEDMDRLIAATEFQSRPGAKSCSFACHETTTYSVEQLAAGIKDNYQIARENKINLRIDTLREATADLIDTAMADQRGVGQFRMSIHTFSDRFENVASTTVNLQNIKSVTSQIELTQFRPSSQYSQTSYIRAMPGMQSYIPASGNGNSASSPMQHLFLITDGVQDALLEFGKTPIPPYELTPEPGRFTGPMDPDLCKTLKDRGVRIGVIHTKYLPPKQEVGTPELHNITWYNTYIKPFAPVVPDRLRACASDGMYYPVEWGDDVSAALHKLFKQATRDAVARLTD